LRYTTGAADVCSWGAAPTGRRNTEADLAFATVILRTNFEAPCLLLGLFAERFQ
jgi:hypothetical protein